MKILFADRLPEFCADDLRAMGHEVEARPDLTTAELPNAIGDTQILVVRSTEVDAATIEAAPSLSFIIRAGAGTNTIDVATASSRGVFVSNVPGRNALAVAELTMGLILALDRNIAASTADLRNGVWNKQAYSQANGLAGATLGLIGLGDIGLAVAERAKAFGMIVVGERKPRAAAAEQRIRHTGVKLVSDRAALLEQADIVSIHVPSTGDTKQMVDTAFLAAMKPGAMLINTSRGDVVDETALLAALHGGLRAGLDVFADEPSGGTGTFVSAVAAHPNVVGTHHIGASTEQAQIAVARGVVDLIRVFGTGEVRDCVNLDEGTAPAATLRVRHLNRVGVLAEVLRELRSAGHNVETMQNRILAGRDAAVADIDIVPTPDDAVVAAVIAIEDVIGARVVS